MLALFFSAMTVVALLFYGIVTLLWLDTKQYHRRAKGWCASVIVSSMFAMLLTVGLIDYQLVKPEAHALLASFGALSVFVLTGIYGDLIHDMTLIDWWDDDS
jgi:hypothetical protein